MIFLSDDDVGGDDKVAIRSIHEGLSHPIEERRDNRHFDRQVAGGDRLAQGLPGLVLNGQPGVDPRLGPATWRKAAMRFGNAVKELVDQRKEDVSSRDQECHEVLQDSRQCVVGHDPHAKSLAVV
jgi:hypothetical protein